MECNCQVAIPPIERISVCKIRLNANGKQNQSKEETKWKESPNVKTDQIRL